MQVGTEILVEDEHEILLESRPEYLEERDIRNFVKIMLKTIFLFQVQMFVSDSSVAMLLGILKFFLYLINGYLGIDLIKEMIDEFPSTMYSARNYIGIQTDQFVKYVVCPKCNTLYTLDEAKKIGKSGKYVSKKCSYIEFKNHRQLHKRRKCGAVLLKKIVSSDGKKNYLYPKKVYCFRSIKDSVESLLQRKCFNDLLFCDHKYSGSDILNDIKDASVFREFKQQDGSWFFSDKRNIGLMMNIDWFQPFKNTEYSLGVIYMVILNLPRESRFLWENVLVIGIIPGPKEPKFHVNTYLEPIVDELLSLWNGVKINDGGIFGESIYKFALLSLSSDIPATRKCGGFLSYSAEKGIDSFV